MRRIRLKFSFKAKESICWVGLKMTLNSFRWLVVAKGKRKRSRSQKLKLLKTRLNTGFEIQDVWNCIWFSRLAYVYIVEPRWLGWRRSEPSPLWQMIYADSRKKSIVANLQTFNVQPFSTLRKTYRMKCEHFNHFNRVIKIWSLFSQQFA